MLFGLSVNVLAICINPLIFKYIFDVALPNKNIHLLIYLLLAVALIYMVSVVATYTQYKLGATIGNTVTNYLHLKMFRYTQSINYDEHDDNLKNNIIMRFTRDIVHLNHVISFTVWIVAQYFLVGVISSILLFYIDFKMTLLVLLLMPIVILIPKYILNKVHSADPKKRELEQQLLSAEKENLDMHDVIRLLRLKNVKRKEFKLKLKEIGNINFIYNFNIALASRSISLGISFITLVMLGAGVYFVIINQTTLGTLVTFIVLLANVASSLNFLSSHSPSLIQGLEDFSHIEELFTSGKKAKKREGARLMGSFKKEIIFENVCAEQNNKQIISNLNLTIPAGKSVVFVGQSGAGKSTILKLFLGDRNITTGRITIDGIDMNSIAAQSLYSNIGFVSQKNKLFQLSIADNIRLGKLKATDDEIYQVARLAEIHDEILALPNGYNTKYIENNLSGGQVQRIAIARALISKPKILCLDEPMSALDTITAAKLEEKLLQFSDETTVLLVTHRLQTAMRADHVFVVDDGRIVEDGNHAQLLDSKGIYYQLWSMVNQPE